MDFYPEIKGGKGSFRVHTKDAFACGPGLGVWTGSPGGPVFSEKEKAPLRSLLKDALAFMNRDCTGAFSVCQHLFFRISGIIFPVLRAEASAWGSLQAQTLDKTMVQGAPVPML